MPTSNPKLPLTKEERVNLRSQHIKLADIANQSINHLAVCLRISKERAKYLRALALFQTIPSIGPKVAHWVVDLNFFSLEELQYQSGADMIDRLEVLHGFWMDPCVEDALRCLVYHANHPDSLKSWFDFTAERKQYRQQHGYPDTRPTRSWEEAYQD